LKSATLLKKRQAAFVLIAVLWMVAALSIIVAGISQSVRSEARLASTTRDSTIANALGEAAIALVLQDLASQQQRPARTAYVSTTYHGVAIEVQVMPLTGLIDINNAPVGILASLLNVAGGLPMADAQRLADTLVNVRSQRDQRGAVIGFEAVEDLLRTPEITYDLYAKIAPLVTADLRGNGKINPMAAPAGVLAVLAEGNIGRASKIAADRDAGVEGIDTSSLNGAFMQGGPSDRVRVVARVPLADNSALVLSRNVDLKDGPSDGLPWRTLQATYRFDPAPTSRN
jgi:general secretion pathway protein K